MKEHVEEWDKFCEAYLAKPPEITEAEKTSGFDPQIRKASSGYRQLVDLVMADSGDVYRPENTWTDLELLLDLTFGCETFKEFLQKHLDPKNDISKLYFDDERKKSYLKPHLSADNKDSPASIEKRPPSLWREHPDYKRLLERLERACNSLTHYVVCTDAQTRQENVPMLRAIENALVEKWLIFRDLEIMHYPLMEERPLSDAVGRGLGVSNQQAMRAEILNTTQGFFAHSLLSKLFSSKCRTGIANKISPLRRKCRIVTNLMPDASEATGSLFASYHHIFDACLFTYDSEYNAKFADSSQEFNSQASFSSFLGDSLEHGLLNRAVGKFKVEHGFTFATSQIDSVARGMVSLDAPLPSKSGTKERAVGDFLAQPESGAGLSSERRAILEDLIEGMKDQHAATIMKSRFGMDGGAPKTPEELASEFGCTVRNVHKIQKKTLEYLRSALQGRDALTR